ncbi:MAG: fumarylacetoacetate hydrolase family protein [Paludibacteraceae bacterium]|nr:fumarylacetoacetate hydrolase family protein [Paludibacteraceae bacterium]
MKIIGFVYSQKSQDESRKTESEWEMVLKGDSCLLNGRKPFFLPEGTHEIGATECVILRVSRLGKGIAPKFAARYYDAVAPGVDFIAMDLLHKAQAAGKPWTQAIAFDYSLAIGEWITNDEMSAAKLLNDELIVSPEEAIAEASKTMTIRQGDLIYIQKKQAPRLVQKEEIIRMEIDGEEKLYCKIK